MRTGTPKGIPLSAEVTQRLQAVTFTPRRPSSGANGAAGNVSTTGRTTSANVGQQAYFRRGDQHALFCRCLRSAKTSRFLVLWSRDHDGTQHNQGDSLNVLVRINGPPSRAAIPHAADISPAFVH